MFYDMRAIEVIEQFESLPLEERGKVIEFITANQQVSIDYADDQSVKAVSEELFKTHSSLFEKLAQ